MSAVKDGVMGLVVGDALGVPVEFMSKEKMEKDPVADMREYGTHNQPKGTWSDDSSMTLALLDSLCSGIDYFDIMDRFVSWAEEGRYTATGERFDIGNTIFKALINYKRNKYDPLDCGGSSEYENGNGSLMRILPIVLYTISRGTDDEKMEWIHNISSLTHAHRRSLMGCGIYAHIVWSLLKEKEDLLQAVQNGVNNAFAYYEGKPEFRETICKYEKVKDVSALGQCERKDIWGAGYVIATLEAAIWSLITTHSYRECVLRAVNLGDDTDTVGAVAGSLAGIWYGMEQIPKEWLAVIKKKEWILELCEKFESR